MENTQELTLEVPASSWEAPTVEILEMETATQFAVGQSFDGTSSAS